jgi:Glyoxalase/Bleomycin resistance protein/Dioxygenase superfamily
MSRPVGPAAIWHVAFAVPQLERAMEEMGEVFSLTWRPIRELGVTMRDDHGDAHEMDVRVTFSVEGPPAIELIEAIPGTPLAPPGGTAFHHLGYWADDRPAETKRLEGLGWACFGRAEPPEHSVGISLHRGPLGMGVEVCDVREERPSLRDMFPPTSPFHGEPTLG